MAIIACIATALAAGGSGVAAADPGDPEPAPPPAPATTIDHDGTFAVGTDIVPGNYSSAGPVGDGTCFWKRVGSDGQTIDNALTKKSQIVKIDASDKSFKTDGCQTWQITDAAPPAPLPPGGALLQLGSMLAGLPHP